MRYTIKEYMVDKPLKDYLLRRMNEPDQNKFVKEIQLRDTIHLGIGMIMVLGFWALTILWKG